MNKINLTLAILFLAVTCAQGARHPLLGGPGLVHVQSAKTGVGFSYRTFNAATAYGNVNYYGASGRQDALSDAWSYHSLGFAPNANFSVMLTGVAHAESWTVNNSLAPQNRDNTLGCPGDAFVSGKYHLSLNDMFELALQPMVSIPMDKKKYQDPVSQSGKFDVGGGALADVNLGSATVYVNAGFLTRGEERAMVPVGAGFEYGINEKISLFAEASGELRTGAQKDVCPDTMYPTGRGFDRTEFRVTPGLRVSPFSYGAVNLAADIGLTPGTPPWQVVLGIDIPAAAGRFLSVTLPGVIAGMIRDGRTGKPVKGMISFPGSGLTGVISDAEGWFKVEVPPGSYQVQIVANGFRNLQRRVTIASRQTETWDVKLNPREAQLTIVVSDGTTGRPMAAIVRFKNSVIPDGAAQPATGQYQTGLAPGKYIVTVTAPGYESSEFAVSLKDKEEKSLSIGLKAQIAAAPPAPVIPPVVSAPGTVKNAGSSAGGQRAVIKTLPAPPKLSANEIANLYKTGVQQYMDEDYGKAIATFQQIIKSDPGNSRARDYLKKAKDRLKKMGG
ncbi:MAG: carboxypeptidase regulatory-like domain-containing protein [Candidatus Edwardsbacteria bacterium]|nr:carboxypeptidase regulatory-like domain-containing protein [Candidatus Edwardsbacteria bacterium]